MKNLKLIDTHLGFHSDKQQKIHKNLQTKKKLIDKGENSVWNTKTES